MLIGSAHEQTEIFKLRRFKNIRFLGVIPHKKVVRYIDEFDVGIVPHVNNEMTRSMNSLKIFVYFLSNKYGGKIYGSN